MIGLISLKATLPPEVEKCRGFVVRWLDVHGIRSVRLLHMVQLSALIDISRLPSKTSDICKGFVVPLALVRSGAKGKCMAVVLDEARGFPEEIRQVIERTKLPCYFGSLSSDLSLKRFLAERFRGGYEPAASGMAAIGNDYELEVFRLTRIALGIHDMDPFFRNRISRECGEEVVRLIDEAISENRRKIRVYQEYALGEIIDIPAGYRNRLDWYRVDILVASSPPDSAPLCVIEFDGPHHDSERKIRGDSARDEALLAAGIPVLRIGYRSEIRSGQDLTFFYFWMIALVERLSNVCSWKRKECRRDFAGTSESFEYEIMEDAKNRKMRLSSTFLGGDELEGFVREAVERYKELEGSDLFLDEIEDELDWRIRQAPESYCRKSCARNIKLIEGPKFLRDSGVRDLIECEMVLNVDSEPVRLASPLIDASIRLPPTVEGYGKMIQEAIVVALLEMNFGRN